MDRMTNRKLDGETGTLLDKQTGRRTGRQNMNQAEIHYKTTGQTGAGPPIGHIILLTKKTRSTGRQTNTWTERERDTTESREDFFDRRREKVIPTHRRREWRSRWRWL